MRIAIVYPPFRKQGKYPLLTQNRQFRFSSSLNVKIFPIIPATAATLLNEKNTVLFLDGINERLTMDEFTKKVYSFNPDYVILETKTPIIKTHWKFIDKLKKRNIKTILVGDHVSVLPVESFKKSNVDFVVTGGDFDVSLNKLINSIKNKKKFPKGVYYKEKNKIKNTGKFELVKNLDTIPFIDRQLTKWHNYGEAYLYKPCAYIMTGRGCGRTNGCGVCKFCIWQHALWKRTARLRSPKNVVDEIELLINKFKVREIFDDNESGAIWNKKWLKEFYKEMKNRKLIGKVILSSNARANTLDKETCSLLKKLNFRLLKVGLESGSNHILRKLNKFETIEEIKKCVKNAKDAGLRIMLTIMVGYPWETEKEVQKTYDVAKELMLYRTKLGNVLQASVIVPYPGTPLHKEAIENNWLLYDKEDYENFDMSKPVLKTKVNAMGWCDKMWDIHKDPKYILKSLLSLRNVSDLNLLYRGIKSVIGHTKDF